MAKKKAQKPTAQISLLDEIEKAEYPLTDEQERFINYKGRDSVLCLASAGSGKTFSCVKRLQVLLERGVDPKKIMFVSFTKAATEELKERVGRNDIRITTIHAYCVHVLSSAKKFKNLTNFFAFIKWYENNHRPTINYNQADLDEFREKVSLMYDDWEVISSKISAYKLQKAEDNVTMLKPNFFNEYLKFQRETRTRDFSDMLIEVHNLFKQNTWLSRFKGQYDYIFIDEFQDTSAIQMRIMLALNAKYYYMIGDLYQCHSEGTLIRTDKGKKKIEEIKIGEQVLSSTGSGNIDVRTVINTKKHKIKEEMLRITLKSGKQIEVTKNHFLFMKYQRRDFPKQFITYLMYKEGLGFRVGVSSTECKVKAFKDIDSGFGFIHRMNTEGADKVWIIETCSSQKKARFYEDYYAAKYGLLKTVFRSRENDQKSIDKLFNEVDTETGGKNLLKDKNLSFKLSHHVAKCSQRLKKNLTLTLCADGRSKRSSHSLELGFSNPISKSILEEHGVRIQNSKDKYRVRFQSTDYGEVKSLANNISSHIDVKIDERAKFTQGSKSLMCLPSSYARVGMTTYIFGEKGVETDIIMSIESFHYSGFVYDIDIENSHNYFANDVSSHNSLYGYSGSDCEYNIEMVNQRRKVIEMTLTKNFRSGVEIVNNSNNFSELVASPSKSEAGNIDKSIKTSVDELVDIMDDNKECAVLVRTNKIIKTLELILLRRKYPMHYFNYFSNEDIKLIRQGELDKKDGNRILKRKWNQVKEYYESPMKLLNFIETHKKSKRFITTIHKSKGREYETVVLVNSVSPELLIENKYDMKALKSMKLLKKISFNYDDDNREAQNIHYVGVTRPKDNLFYMLYGGTT